MRGSKSAAKRGHESVSLDEGTRGAIVERARDASTRGGEKMERVQSRGGEVGKRIDRRRRRTTKVVVISNFEDNWRIPSFRPGFLGVGLIHYTHTGCGIKHCGVLFI